MRFLSSALLLLLSVNEALAFDYIRYQAPATFESPIVSRSALGATYDYRPRDRLAGTTLQITVARVPPGLSGTQDASPAGCVTMFVQALRQQVPDLFALASPSTLRAGPLDFAQWRWTRRRGAEISTGVLACTLYKQHFVAINFSAPSKGSPRALNDLRRSLAALELNF